eukprot:gene33701-43559_t
MDNFCHMIIEEYLTRKQLKATLDTFREESKKAYDDSAIISWYEIALKLRLPELVDICKKGGSGGKNTALPTSTLMHCLVQSLLRDSSLKNRRPVDVTLTGLASSIQRNHNAVSEPPSPNFNSNSGNLPSLSASGFGNASSPRALSPHSMLYGDDGGKDQFESNNKQQMNKILSNVHLKRQLDNVDRNLAIAKNNLAKTSSENWIPEEVRMRSMYREFQLLKENLGDIRKREEVERVNMKVLSVTDLQRAQIKESLGATKKINCGCCLRKYLDVNLPLRVSQKAIMDIRIYWSGNLTSATVFGGEPVKPVAKTSDESLADGQDPGEEEGGDSNKKQMILQRLGCYDKFFQKQEAYRPSYSEIVQSERKAVYLENKRREEEYWDPLKMMEKDRAAIELRKKNSLIAVASTSGSVTGADSTT